MGENGDSGGTARHVWDAGGARRRGGGVDGLEKGGRFTLQNSCDGSRPNGMGVDQPELFPPARRIPLGGPQEIPGLEMFYDFVKWMISRAACGSLTVRGRRAGWGGWPMSPGILGWVRFQTKKATPLGPAAGKVHRNITLPSGVWSKLKKVCQSATK